MALTAGLIGFSGFVGHNLDVQRSYDLKFNSKNFRDMTGMSFSRLVCAGVSAVKWLANKEPEADIARINELIEVLKTVKAEKFILISTIDVYSVYSGVNEDFDCHNPSHHAYGRNRLYFEDFCRQNFPDILVVRLPGLFGDGLRKNVIFDLLNNNCLDMIQKDSAFQYYYLENLSDDIERAEKAGLKLVNLFTEPIFTSEIINTFFPGTETGQNAGPAVSYAMQTKHSALWGGDKGFCYSRKEVLAQLQEFIGRYRR